MQNNIKKKNNNNNEVKYYHKMFKMSQNKIKYS